MRGRPRRAQAGRSDIVYRWRNLRLLKVLEIREKSPLFSDDLPFAHLSGSGGLESVGVMDQFLVWSISYYFSQALPEAMSL